MFMGFSYGEDFDKKENETVPLNENKAMQQNNVMEIQHHHHGDEKDADFWPVEHPAEPRDEDRPVKCPMPESSVINDGGMHERRFAESLRKRVEVPAIMVDSNRERTAAMDPEPPTRAVRKRHHTLSNGNLGNPTINENATITFPTNPEHHHLSNASKIDKFES